jgi:uncharacterized membrane protein YfcA
MPLEAAVLPEVLTWPGLVLLGFAVGAYGTMIGAGGGFLLVPLLLLLYPGKTPSVITSISLAVVFANALSGTFAYVRQKRVDFLAANRFALATIPGAVAGAFVTTLLPRRLFDGIFGLLLLGVSTLLAVRPVTPVATRRSRAGEVERYLTDAAGDTYYYSYNLRLGIALSVVIGFLSSLLGVGGGIIHVPVMVLILHFPAHVATATSHYVLAVSAASGTTVHLASGELAGTLKQTSMLALGVLGGAQAGARFSSRVNQGVIIRLLGVALAAVGLRLLYAALL